MRTPATHALFLVSALTAVAFGGSPEQAAAQTPAAQRPPAASQPIALQRPSTPDPAGQTLAPPNAAFAEFKERLQEYLALRDKVESSVPNLTETKDPKKIAERAALLAAGIQAARKNVTQGTIFTPTVAAEIRRILAADAASRTASDKTSIMAEVPEQPPTVNGVYPTDSPEGPAALPSFPSKLLAVLPELPETVEYRFLGQALVLRDASANVIVDYLPSVAPARPGGGVQ
jgi:hypothetical protein